MKKFIMMLALAGFMITGISQVANAQTEQTQTKTLPQEKSEFKSIELTDLPEEVRAAAVKNDMGATIQSAEVKNKTTGEKIYRVNLSSAKKGEYSLKFYSDGRPYEK
jgi:hypothetical protein